ncbi:hypothetical protein ACFSTA_20610 [Ornithinibacillus salinisoli]|uniref:IDEAL domain-containing protein n=1 Tax=Ornithinibacillus salinisoli TaxID=1848459 RepID=A0ABW4W5P6_9BACI
MNENHHNEEQQLLIKKIVDNYMKESTERLYNEDKEITNNSFIFLENNTIHMIMTYMLMHLDTQRSQGNTNEVKSQDLQEISESLDSLIEENNLVFKEIINLLQEKN